ncbi:hypothetical protein FACS1894132_13660 [Clostridia bacterium]|nr:hypothetical protein FACS1894132_13660 [Clostridia bacterium]
MAEIILNGRNYSNVFAWEPNEEQWWITGFSPTDSEPISGELTTIGTIDFSGHLDLFNMAKSNFNISENDDFRQNIVIDDSDNTVWIIWDMVV